MQFKSIIGVLLALLPVIYCGSLLYYFLDSSGSLSDAQAIGLGPTLMGLAIVGLLFCIPVIVKLVWIFIAPRAPGTNARSSRDESTNEDAFDGDAALARYMARRSAEAASGAEHAVPADDGAPRATFGRKVR